MAVAVDYRHKFKPAARNRRHRLLSSPHLDLKQFDIFASNINYNNNHYHNHNRSHNHPTPLQKPNPCIHRSLSTPCLLSSGKVGSSVTAEFSSSECNRSKVEIVMGKRSPGVNALVVEAAIAAACGAKPIFVPGSAGGVYYLVNRSGNNFAVLKTVSDEPIVGLGLDQRSICDGNTGVREVAAYLLDHGGFSGVPPTVLVKVSEAAFQIPTSPSSAPRHRIASIQRFVAHEFDSGDLGPSRFSISSVHRIGILDIRLLNIDRHTGNILVKDPYSKRENTNDVRAELVPIDHGLCLPEVLEDPYFEWLHWPQATVPFSDIELEYIATLEPFKDAALLRSELPLLKESSIRIMILCTLFLKHAAATGFCLEDIGDMMTHRFCNGGSSSVLEHICRKLIDTNDGHYLAEVLDMEIDTAEEQGAPPEQTHSGGLPPKPPKKYSLIRSTSMFPSHENEKEEKEERADPLLNMGNGLTKSMSFSVPDLITHEKYLSFKDMSDEEWDKFMKRFQETLPEVFEERKNLKLGSMKQRSVRYN